MAEHQVERQQTQTAIEPWLASAGIAAADGYQWLPAHRFVEAYHPIVEVELPLVITGCSADLAWDRLFATLANAYPRSHRLYLGQVDETAAATTLAFTLGDLLALQPETKTVLDSTVALCIPPLPEGSSFSALQAIVAHLQSPAGCPWDQAQTLLTMRHDLLGECAEVIEAIDRETAGIDNSAHIAEELGDLFMAAVAMVQIATTNGRFQLADAMHSIVSKLIRRHPHVFGEVEVDGVDAVWANWDQIKQQEKLAKGQAIGHPLDGIPAALPALEKARELQSKAQKANLLDRAAVAATTEGQLDALQAGRVSEEALGALLWTLVAVAHGADLNAEDALRSYCVQFRAGH